ncbi:MAG: hypothetical protein AABM67_03660 [Acidobacteriota bacterium]
MDSLDIISKVAVTVASVLASVFVIYKFKKAREAEGILEIKVDIKSNDYLGKHLVDVSIEVSNVGKAASFISADACKYAVVMIRKLTFGDADAALQWEQLKNDKLIDDMPYLDIYGAEYPDEPLIFEPNSKDTYHVFFSTGYSGPIWIRVVLIDKDDYSWIANRMFILEPFPLPR